MADYKFKEITEKIIGSCMKVHALGNGFQEVIYQRALEIEINFGSISLEFKRLGNQKFIPNPFPVNQ